MSKEITLYKKDKCEYINQRPECCEHCYDRCEPYVKATPADLNNAGYYRRDKVEPIQKGISFHCKCHALIYNYYNFCHHCGAEIAKGE